MVVMHMEPRKAMRTLLVSGQPDPKAMRDVPLPPSVWHNPAEDYTALADSYLDEGWRHYTPAFLLRQQIRRACAEEGLQLSEGQMDRG